MDLLKWRTTIKYHKFLVIIFLIFISDCSKTPPKFNPLSLKWAKYIAVNPQNKKDKVKQENFIRQAKVLSDQGYALYKRKRDKVAVKKYEEALKLHATGELYFNYGNSLINISRLKDSLKAYKISIALGYTNNCYVAYNMACVFSRLGIYKECRKWLLKAIHIGYDSIKFILNDSDLVKMRKSKIWKQCLNSIYQAYIKKNYINTIFKVPMLQEYSSKNNIYYILSANGRYAIGNTIPILLKRLKKENHPKYNIEGNVIKIHYPCGNYKRTFSLRIYPQNKNTFLSDQYTYIKIKTLD